MSPAPPLLVVKDTLCRTPPTGGPDQEVLGFYDLAVQARRPSFLLQALRRPSARLLTARLDTLSFPLATALVLRYLSRGPVVFTDQAGNEERITLPRLARLAAAFVRDKFRAPRLREAMRRRAAALADPPSTPPVLDLNRPPLYLRTDLWWGARCGGSIGHIAGVLNTLGHFSAPPVFVTTETIPTVTPSVETHLVLPGPAWQDFLELPQMAFNDTVLARCRSVLADRTPAFVYQRMSVHNLAGAELARSLGVPFVLEYNGSEVWISRHWGQPLYYEDMAAAAEESNLRAADLVVAVSSPMRDEIARRGISPDKVLVNPNGVNPDMYRPDVDGSAVRARHGLEGKLVVGFIGTFGRWHGAEVLAEAFARLMEEAPGRRGTVRLFYIGDGATMPEVRRTVAERGISPEVAFAGVVPQAEGPAHLAACDVLASPHVPNPDGTPFFGSPTKLFEYMAMGRAIVASDLDQVGEVLEHEVTALKVRPGDPADLARSLAILLADPALRARMGHAARQRALERHTWEQHTGHIIAALRERVPCA